MSKRLTLNLTRDKYCQIRIRSVFEFLFFHIKKNLWRYSSTDFEESISFSRVQKDSPFNVQLHLHLVTSYSETLLMIWIYFIHMRHFLNLNSINPFICTEKTLASCADKDFSTGHTFFIHYRGIRIIEINICFISYLSLRLAKGFIVFYYKKKLSTFEKLQVI